METHVAAAVLGGALIGLASGALLFFNGTLAGVSGILAGALRGRRRGSWWQWAFVAGLLAGGLVLRLVRPEVFADPPLARTPLLGIAGVLVGFGARVGNGCTSGHGVCGIARGSRRGLVATLTFMTTAAVTVYLVDHVLHG